MIRSTLPDLFKTDLNTIKFHPEDRPKKVGGRFSIKLSDNNHSLNSSNQDQINIKSRSQSIGNIAPAIKYESSLRNGIGYKKSVVFD